MDIENLVDKTLGLVDKISSLVDKIASLVDKISGLVDKGVYPQKLEFYYAANCFAH